jgi:hypothetical protein
VRSRLLVTTTFQTTSPSALAMASGLGLDVRVLNPGSGRTFHPKLYLGTGVSGANAVIGSANLTGGLATNFEAAVSLRGARDDLPLAKAWSWAEELWADDRVVPWAPIANHLPVHRSSAVCAILGRLPKVERAPGREIVLRWR